MSFKLKQAAIGELEKYNMDDLFPNVENELIKIINMKEELKQGIVNHLIRDAAGHQFNAIRLCSVPEPYDEFEEELEDIQSDLEELDKEDPRYSDLAKKARKLERKIKKLKDPHKYMDTVCESFKNCPLFKSGDAPEGCLCPFEYKLVSDWTEGYLKEFDVHIAVQGVDKSIVSQLVVSDLIIYRCMKAIASTSLVDISEKPTEFGISYEKKINSYLDIKEKESKNKLKLLNNMIATRSDKKRFKVEDKKSNLLKNAEDNMSKFIKEKESIRKTGMKTLINVKTEVN
ncbi:MULTISPECIES: hypothetical protein [Bacteria]|uniref:hypothetical protein n=1 Tax=Bacteria TaxID=2 RepID=UPI002E7C4CFE|nr:hypothetical protein [Cetobacterium somerae]WVJ03021.1 hypothetical protein VSU16_14925 [Cetobacterium somerae]